MLLYIGLAIFGIGIVMYIMNFIIYNHYLRKNDPGLQEKIRAVREENKNASAKNTGKRQKEIRVIHTKSNAPAWVFLLGFFAFKVIPIGILVIILGLIVRFFRWIF